LFIPAGGNRVDPSKAAVAAGERLGRADVTFVGTQTGFAIGGVAPVGHLSAPKAFFDSTLLKFDVVYAAAGTRYQIFPIHPREPRKIFDSQVFGFIQYINLM
jgi:prolyl-tRNA editing enzyme YbaK/EbsC (Cys-tRNA(Pro) deacylase)